MTQYKESPSDILALYDNIAYAKGIFKVFLLGDYIQSTERNCILSGGSFLRMFYNVVGDELFFKAVTELLNTA